MACPYCNTDLPNRYDEAVWLDLGARVLSGARTLLEMRATGHTWRECAGQVIGRDDPPELDATPIRLCPNCRKRMLTCEGENVLWLDFSARLLGLGRSYLLARGDGLRGLATSLVDGDDAVRVNRAPEHGETHESHTEDTERAGAGVTSKIQELRRRRKGRRKRAYRDVPGEPRD